MRTALSAALAATSAARSNKNARLSAGFGVDPDSSFSAQYNYSVKVCK